MGEGWEAGRVLRQPRLGEDGVVGGKDRREEGRQDEEEVQKGWSSVRSIDLGTKIALITQQLQNLRILYHQSLDVCSQLVAEYTFENAMWGEANGGNSDSRWYQISNSIRYQGGIRPKVSTQNGIRLKVSTQGGITLKVSTQDGIRPCNNNLGPAFKTFYASH